MVNDFKRSKKAHVIILCAIFAIMLLFNALTQLLADDFQYSFSFATGMPITSFEDSIASIIKHGECFNGRYFAHYIVQVCLLLPPFVFDLINTTVFIATVYIVYAICNRGKENNNTLLIGIFGCVWLFEHDFGQVNFWLDGSCNYLFAILFGLFYIYPFIRSLLFGKKNSIWMILPHILVAFWFGGYLEMTSVGFIGASCLFVAAELFFYKNYRALLLVPSIIVAFLGFLTIVNAPAQAFNKLTEFSFSNMLTTFGVALLMVASIIPIIILYVVFFKRALKEGTERRVLLTSLIIAAGALASNFVLIIAKYYALRCSISFVFMAIFATALLYGNLQNQDFGRAEKKLSKVFAVVLSLAIVIGLVDNVITFTAIEDHKQIIAEALERGEDEVELCRPVPFTKYNALWGLRYLDIKSPDGWPNIHFAKYYGLEKAYGTSIFGDTFKDW